MRSVRRLLLIPVFLFTACQTDNTTIVSKENASTELNQKIRLTDLEGNMVKLDRYKGKTVFINFWATWCKPCIEEMPSIEKAQAILGNQEIVFLLASGETVEEIQAFSNDHRYQFTYLRFENDALLNIQALPTTFIFNADGDLVFSEMGFRNWDSGDNIHLIKSIIKQHD